MPKPESAPVDQLLREAEPIIRRLVRSRLRHRPADVREDIEQRCRVYLWQHALPKFDPTQGPFDAFVVLCLTRRIGRYVDGLDADPTHETLPDDSADLSAPADHDHDELAATISGVVGGRLNERESELLRLLMDGYQPREIADLTGIEAASARQALCRLRKKIVPLVDALAA